VLLLSSMHHQKYGAEA